MPIAIRPLETTDRAAWGSLWSGYLEFYGVDLAPEITAATWRRLLDGAAGLHGLCAVDEAGGMLGIAHYLFHPVTWSLTERCYLEDLYVAEAARGAGVGRRLMEAVFAAGDEKGAEQVYWLTHHTNRTARRLYERVGHLTPFVKYQR
jgi:ribosomal protein S18 acetylase RimI-like enzyme